MRPAIPRSRGRSWEQEGSLGGAGGGARVPISELRHTRPDAVGPHAGPRPHLASGSRSEAGLALAPRTSPGRRGGVRPALATRCLGDLVTRPPGASQACGVSALL